ncbi:hypothetical protein [Halobacillus litoralis]|uniref:hypothetical protein n=1 Tax=Halobacillus litoralis TaxID=45668 RepID=UPI001CD1CA06|nr:hypothetical protein [Halobacillus litoralis]MCA1021536.1 hypothetical protein [Halobacillus litoralis]
MKKMFGVKDLVEVKIVNRKNGEVVGTLYNDSYYCSGKGDCDGISCKSSSRDGINEPVCRKEVL